MMSKYKRPLFNQLYKRMQEPSGKIQIITGPRQVGKTTLAQQLLESLPYKGLYTTADSPFPQGPAWLIQEWEKARFYYKESTPVLLVIDEVQKIQGWAEVVKKLFDEDRRLSKDVRVILLGSSALLVQKGLTESLAGRFEKTILSHWSYTECKDCFGLSLDDYILFGGYPGAIPLIKEQQRWKQYIRDSLIEPVISKDILLLNIINKPALFRQLFALACTYGGQVVSYQKLLGQLQDAGNTTTLAHYQQLLENSWIIKGLHKFQGSELKQRTSSPKWVPLNTALMTAMRMELPKDILHTADVYGRVVEVAVGAHLVNSFPHSDIQVYYWKKGYLEVDYIIKSGKSITALEVKSGNYDTFHKGLAAFRKEHPSAKILTIGGNGIPLHDFFTSDPQRLAS